MTYVVKRKIYSAQLWVEIVMTKFVNYLILITLKDLYTTKVTLNYLWCDSILLTNVTFYVYLLGNRIGIIKVEFHCDLVIIARKLKITTKMVVQYYGI